MTYLCSLCKYLCSHLLSLVAILWSFISLGSLEQLSPPQWWVQDAKPLAKYHLSQASICLSTLRTFRSSWSKFCILQQKYFRFRFVSLRNRWSMINVILNIEYLNIAGFIQCVEHLKSRIWNLSCYFLSDYREGNITIGSVAKTWRSWFLVNERDDVKVDFTKEKCLRLENNDREQGKPTRKF